MKIHVLSDLHLEFAPVVWPEVEADVVVLAGDIGVGKHGLKWILQTIRDRPAIYVSGNHEYYGQKIPKLTRELKELAVGTNVHFLENESAVIGDVEFFGGTLWTDFELYGNPVLAGVAASVELTDFRRIRVEPTYRRFRPLDARQSVPKRVVVTHHAPSARSLSPFFPNHPLNPAFASRLDELIEELAPAIWIHGHIHHPSDYRIGGTRVLANPRGYPGENRQGFHPELVVEV
jgi:Icc-related predicted phosphoesterase